MPLEQLPSLNLRIKQLIDYYSDGNVNNFADKLVSISQQRLNRLFNIDSRTGKYPTPTTDILVAITEMFVEINAVWLLTGNGEMFNTPVLNGRINSNTPNPVYTESDQNYTKSASTLTPKQGKKLTPALTPTLNMGVPQVVTVDNLGRDNVPLVPVRARAGYLSGYGDPEYIKELPSYNLPTLRNGTYRAFEVEGHSMTPTLKNHDIVVGEWVENLDYIKDDRVYIVVTKTSGIVVKRVLNRIFEYGFIVAKSDAVNNRQDYPNLKIMPEDIIEIWYARLYISAEFKAPSDMWQRLNDLEAGLEMVKKKLGE
ncbi:MULTISPECIES: S24 family peptidase [Olivibacter]|uniref:Helix-turn-helix transcriptional regulator n=1 Tax=Olivibacter jilunii TaxID=985016 RepID=A0ABW6AVU7_9SPHI